MHELYETFRDSDKYPAFWEGGHVNCMPHFHRSLEFTYVTGGVVHAMVNGKNLPVPAGSLLLISGYAAHSYYESERSTSILLIVPPDFIPLYAPLLSGKAFPQCISRDAKLNREVLHCLRQILSLGRCSEQTENLIKSYIYVILGLVIRAVGLTDLSGDSSFLREVLMYLQDSYLGDIALDSLARRFGYSKYRFSHIFNEYLGCSLSQYVGSLRCRHASNLLRESSLPLVEVAMSSGFESMRTFYRSFRSYFGVTPTEYRRSAVGRGGK